MKGCLEATLHCRHSVQLRNSTTLGLAPPAKPVSERAEMWTLMPGLQLSGLLFSNRFQADLLTTSNILQPEHRNIDNDVMARLPHSLCPQSPEAKQALLGTLHSWHLVLSLLWKEICT